MKRRLSAQTNEHLLSGGWLWSIRVPASVALAISIYLVWASWTGDPLPGCGPNSGCDAVLHSRWSYWLGIPVSLGAAAMYVGTIILTVLLGRGRPVADYRRYWACLRAVALTVLGAAAWFVSLQAFAVKTFCPYCMAAHACGSVMALAILLFRPSAERLREELPKNAERAVARGGFGWPSAAAATVLAGLVTGQLVHQPATFAVQPMRGTGMEKVAKSVSAERPAMAAPEGATTTGAGSGGTSKPPAGPFLQLHNGAFELDLSAVPLIGKPDAPCVMVSLFDYTCSHCRAAHPVLLETYRALSNQVAIVSLPVPLDCTCNWLLKKPIPAQTNACAYARIGLAVWRADRRQMLAFDDWLFSFPHPPSTNAAWEHAAGLVGTNALVEALKDPWIEDQIRQDIRIHHTNYVLYAKSSLPQLIIGKGLLAGAVQKPQVLIRFVCTQYGLPVP